MHLNWKSLCQRRTLGRICSVLMVELTPKRNKNKYAYTVSSRTDFENLCERKQKETPRNVPQQATSHAQSFQEKVNENTHTNNKIK